MQGSRQRPRVRRIGRRRRRRFRGTATDIPPLNALTPNECNDLIAFYVRRAAAVVFLLGHDFFDIVFLVLLVDVGGCTCAVLRA